jgi:hypothetical protein
MSDGVVKRARAVLEAASPGPMRAERDGALIGFLSLHDGTGEVVTEAFGDCSREDGDGEDYYPHEPDARAITLAVNALPALLDVLEAGERWRPRATRWAPCRECTHPQCGLDRAFDAALAVLRKECGDG